MADERLTYEIIDLGYVVDYAESEAFKLEEGVFVIQGNAIDRLAAYEDLGSVEELKVYKESSIDAIEMCQIGIVLKELKQLKKKIADGRLVEVVRCRDCKYRNTSSCILSQYDAFGKKTTIKTVYLDDYCSRGERRDE